jgi:hypothetical protein
MAGRKHPFIPEFHSEDEEREFWEQVDLAKFIECPADEIVLELRPKRRMRKKVTSEVSEDEARLLLAIKLYELGRLSLGQSAKLAGYSKRAFHRVVGEVWRPCHCLPTRGIARGGQ